MDQNHSVVPIEGQTSECGGISIQVGDLACLKSEEFSQARDANREPSGVQGYFGILVAFGSTNAHCC